MNLNYKSEDKIVIIRGEEMQKYRVKIYDYENNEITNDIWYGYTIDNVKFWVDMALREMMDSGKYRGLYYYIDSE